LFKDLLILPEKENKKQTISPSDEGEHLREAGEGVSPSDEGEHLREAGEGVSPSLEGEHLAKPERGYTKKPLR
jgi:hypothetical protein